MFILYTSLNFSIVQVIPGGQQQIAIDPIIVTAPEAAVMVRFHTKFCYLPELENDTVTSFFIVHVNEILLLLHPSITSSVDLMYLDI